MQWLKTHQQACLSNKLQVLDLNVKVRAAVMETGHASAQDCHNICHG
jgi:hypothetical protein